MKDFKLDKSSTKELWELFKLVAIIGAFIGGFVVFVSLIVMFFLLPWPYISLNTLILVLVLVILYNQQFKHH